MIRVLCSKCEIVFDRWCPDCTYADEQPKISDDRVVKGMYLRDWSKKDDDVRDIVVRVCAANGVMTYAELAEKHPEAFDELYEIVADLLEESPSMGHLPGFMQ